MAGIYVHVPFCRQKCIYCDFASYPREIGKAEAYFACLIKETRHRARELKDKKFDTVYFGGGTPSFVDEKFILGEMRLLKQEFQIAEDAEATIEINPESLTKVKLATYLAAGFNRFSVGLQCADDGILAALGRVHNTADFVRTMKLLKGRNVSADVMIGLENQTKEHVKRSIDLAIENGASHISLYALKAEEGTIMYSHYLNGDLPSEDEVADAYDFSREYLKSLGFLRYEVSNFAKKGFESRHNMNYWRRGEYIGLGVSASSFIDERRFTNTESIDEYVHLLLHDKYAEVFSERIEGDERRFEYVMLALRTSRGILFDEYERTFGDDFNATFSEKLKMLSPYLDVSDEGVKIKDEYLYVQNNIIIQFMD